VNVGRRGPGALVTRRARGRRGAVKPGEQFPDGGPEFWDVVLGGKARVWRDRLDPERGRCWQQWRSGIMARWPSWWRCGRRPSAFWAFDLSLKVVEAVKAGQLTVEQFRKMPRLEVLYRLGGIDAEERVEIEEQWASELARALKGAGSPEERRRRAVERGVPEWFIDKRLPKGGDGGERR
jgi:hypothetical protein